MSDQKEVNENQENRSNFEQCSNPRLRAAMQKLLDADKELCTGCLKKLAKTPGEIRMLEAILVQTAHRRSITRRLIDQLDGKELRL